jgi:vancomycin resistance protein YoaR
MKRAQKLLLAIIILICSSALIWAGFKLVFYGKFYPNSRVAGISISSLTDKQAEAELTKQVESFKNQTIWFEFDNKTFAYEIDFKKIDFKIEATIKKARAENRLSDLVYGANYPLEISTDNKLKKNIISFFEKHINQELREESIELKNGNISYQEDQPGVRLNEDQTWQNFLDAISNLENNVGIKAEIEYPNNSQNLLETYHKLANLINLTPIKIIDSKNNRTIVTIDQTDIISWLKLENRRKDKCKIEEGCLLTQAMQPITTQTGFDQEKLESWVSQIASQVDQKPSNAQLSFDGKKIVIEEPAQFGYKIDLNNLKNQIISLIDSPKSAIDIEVKIDKPEVREDNLDKLGIKELVGRGETTFYGSSDNRIHNIKTGASRVSGALIEPGETFSAAERIGEVSKNTGYLPEYVIKGKETIKEYGGGLCQVSSTLFRAAIRSGFEIVERHPHAYRVSYYEPPIGMDAAIYVPWTDLKFTNNTDNWVLIQYEMEGYHLAFNVYGADDGRKIDISEPKAFNFKNPPKPITIKDKTLKPGERVIEEKARQGADASFKYQVKKDGEYIINTTINSHYQAWPAKVRVGPDKKKDDKKKSDKREDDKKN